MTQIRVGTEEYVQLLREWSALRRFARAWPLSKKDAVRLKEVSDLLHEAELATYGERYASVLYSEEGAASA